MAGVIPGLLMAAIFAAWTMGATALGGRTVRREPRASLAEALGALRRSAWALTLPALVLGGMYAGVFTATEAAAAGALLAVIVGAAVYRTIRWGEIWDSALDASRTSAMLFMILAGASVFGFVLTKMRVPHQVVELVSAFGLGPIGFLLVMMALLVVLGMFLESIAIILITTPVILPVMAHLGINPIWYGVLLTINLELAMITPPVGMNLFTIKAVTRAPIGDIIRGSAPYVVLMLACLAVVMALPQLALWLPGTMLNVR
jgi:C4-dicarboxylate transporter DctM subunit